MHVSVRPVRAIRRFTVRPVLPPALTALGELAGNLRWSWHPPTQDVFAEVDADRWDASGHDPVKLLGCGRPPTGSTQLAADDDFLARLGAARADLERLPDAATAGTSGAWRRTAARGRSPTSRRSSASPRVLPQYSGGLGILAGDHLKAASDLGVPIIGVGLLLPARLLPAVDLRRGLAAGDLPGARPRRPADLAAARGRRVARRRSRSTCPADRRCSRGSGWPSVGRVPLLMLDTDVEDNPDHYAASPTGSTAAAASTGCARSCCSASAACARCAPTAALTGHPAARRVPHQRGPRRLPRHRADPRAHRRRGGPGLDFDAALAGRPRLHRLHHPHPGAGRHRPVPARPRRSSTSRRRRRTPGVPTSTAILALGARGLRRRRPERLQHGA